MNSALTLGLAAWLGTYLLHSTLLYGAAWLATRRSSSAALREWTWRLALVGALISASVSSGLGRGLPLVAETIPIAEAIPEAPSDEGSAPLTFAVAAVEPAGEWEAAAVAGPRRPPVGAPIAVSAVTDAAPRPATPSWPALIAGLWLAGAGVLVARLGLELRRLQADLRGRRIARRGPLVRVLAQLCREAGLRRPVRLSISPHLRTPVALAGEISLPERAVELEPAQQEALLAHELAHVKRRDPAWFRFLAAIEALLFLQPLNRLVARTLREEAELRCDDWAAGQRRRGLELARCLCTVASWLGAERTSRLGATMVRRRSKVVTRVERLLDGRDPGADPRGLALLALGSAALTAALACGGPGVSSSTADAADGADPAEPADLESAPDPAELALGASAREADTSGSGAVSSIAEVDLAGEPAHIVIAFFSDGAVLVNDQALPAPPPGSPRALEAALTDRLEELLADVEHGPWDPDQAGGLQFPDARATIRAQATVPASSVLIAAQACAGALIWNLRYEELDAAGQVDPRRGFDLPLPVDVGFDLDPPVGPGRPDLVPLEVSVDPEVPDGFDPALDLTLEVAVPGERLDPETGEAWSGAGPFVYGADRQLVYGLGGAELRFAPGGGTSDLAQFLEAASPGTRVLIDCGPGVVYTDVAQVIDLLMEAGIERIHFVGVWEE